MSSIEDMIHQAELDIGLGEPNKIQDWYRKRNGMAKFNGNFAWCDASDHVLGLAVGQREGEFTFGKDFALTTAHAQAFETHDQWHVDTAGIQRGDIVFFDWGGTDLKSAIDHVGLVTGGRGREGLHDRGQLRRRVRPACAEVQLDRRVRATELRAHV